jgi:DNA-binding PadR family transcriptional regulator
MASREPGPLTPLTVPAFQILLSLWDRPLHGYAIIRDVEQRTDGEVRLTASTLYGAIARLLDEGLIEEVAVRDAAEARRRPYRIVPLGRHAVRAEAARLERQLAMARAKRVLGMPSTAGSAHTTIGRPMR